MFLGMSMRKIQIWFQNRRTKEKTKIDCDVLSLIGDVNKRDSITGNTPLFVAAAAGDNIVSQLILNGADSNITNNEGISPLYIAVLNEHSNIVDILLSRKNKCNPNLKDFKYGQTPLHVASMVNLTSYNFITKFTERS